jgi:hypothetical protein
MYRSVTRRQALTAVGVSAAFSFVPETYDSALVQRHDEGVDRILQRQITDVSHPHRGGYPDDTGLYYAGVGSGIIDTLTAAFLCQQSLYYQKAMLLERIRLAARYIEDLQTPDGNIDNPITNFNSPPDTAFAVHGVASAARLAQVAGNQDLLGTLEPFLKRAGAGIARGGVHTPNHRWVVCQALSQVDEVFPDPRYRRRIDQWLAEGIDIDEDGQFNERSTTVYNGVTDIALTVIALKTGKVELLDSVRRNLDSMLYLLHADGEVVTEISTRQDQYERADMIRYWLPLRYLAIHDGNGRYATLARSLDGRAASLSALMQYPELRNPLPPDESLPDDFEKVMPQVPAARIRRGRTSATILLQGNSRFFSVRRGAAVIEAVRLASAFFGKGQFVPERWERTGGGFALEQSLDGPYFQPFTPPQKVQPHDWSATRGARPRSEICRLTYSAHLSERPNGFSLDLSADGTKKVPVVVEVNLRPGGTLDGCTPAKNLEGAWLLREGNATYRFGDDVIRFGPGLGEHSYVQVRGAEPRLRGTSAFLCGFTPFRHRLDFDWGV